jgi:hypothetical protein
MSKLKPLLVAIILVMTLLVACQADGTPTPGSGAPDTNSADDAAVTAARAHLVEVLGIADGDIEFVSSEATDFNDSCLGLGGPDESCLQAITPGWVVMLRVGAQDYELHTDEAGEQVRLAEAAE